MNDSPQNVFEQVCDLDAAERSEALVRLCSHDTQLRVEVESLLQAHDGAGPFLDEPTIDTPRDEHAIAKISEGPGSVVDRYKLLEKIGEGGFGVVYMAQQSEPIRRRVALKIIKLGMDTKQVVARFEAERQALAVMDHPNIARVIDGGSTETGRPFFVMELVRGDPITTFCDQKRLPLRQRLELFQQVCRAVEHAHQKGIIHRDIKPSNVLVTIADDKPLVKVIDFGIAKATNSELTEKTLFTEFRQLIGTPQYMSPEQAERSGVDVDTRTDVYSLGVLLYEILTGRTPLDPKKLNSAAWGELQRMIVDDEPSRPSVMVSSSGGELAEVAKRRATEPSRLGTLLRGDLDWIVLKAIEKDRSRRYSTASHFAADIDRFLGDQPVEATPPSTAYQLRKFARRNRALLATSAVVFFALVIGLVATSWTAAWAMQERKAAEYSQHQAQQQAASARRAVTLAAASEMLPESEARSLADAFKGDIERLASAKGSDHRDVVKMEMQYAAWFANWLLEHEQAKAASELVDACYDRAKKVVGIDDPSFLALCNTRIHANAATAADQDQNADTFGDLVRSIEAIHGEGEAAVLCPEYAAALAAAGRGDDAADAISRYLAYRKTQTARLSVEENTRIDLAITRLMTWGGANQELFRQLQSIRETGVATARNARIDNDEELAADLAKLQGRWEYKREVDGRIVEHQVVEIVDRTSTTEWINEDGHREDGSSARLELSRSGGVKVMTNYLGPSSDAGVSLIYRIDKNRLTIVSGMLGNRKGLRDVTFRQFDRVAAE